MENALRTKKYDLKITNLKIVTKNDTDNNDNNNDDMFFLLFKKMQMLPTFCSITPGGLKLLPAGSEHVLCYSTSRT
jgi:hypothetical protein